MSQTQRIGFGLLVALTVPFIVTGLFRVLPGGTPTVLPFAALTILAVALLASNLRWLGAGLLVGAAVFAGFLLWLFVTTSDGLSAL